MKKLLRYLKPYTKESIIAPLFKLLEAGFDLMVPFVVRRIMDDAIPTGDTAQIWQLCGVLVLFALTNYMSQILVELVKLANTIIMINKGVASAARMEAVLEEPVGMPVDPSLPAPANAAGTAVAFDRVGLTYSEGADPSLTGITFTAAPGETIGIIGSTGSGKTSVVNLIARFYDATAGTVAVDGVDGRAQRLEVAQDLQRAQVAGVEDEVGGAEAIDAVLIQNGEEKPLKLRLPAMTAEERDIVLAGCLINYYAKD